MKTEWEVARRRVYRALNAATREPEGIYDVPVVVYSERQWDELRHAITEAMAITSGEDLPRD